MDSFIYALVLLPSLRELLPRSGIAPTKGNVGFYGGLLFALFLFGWGMAFLWGPIGDKFGRVRTLMLTIVWYSVFTFLSALVTGVWQLAVLRLLAGIGIGGEWAMGGTFVAEEWPEPRRLAGAGLMHTGYYVGTFFASLANYVIGSHFGWRTMFAVGGLPALLLAWVRHGVTEPERWRQKEGVVRSGKIWRPFSALFSNTLRRRTVLNSLYMLASICGLWAGTVYVPAAVTTLAEAAGKIGPPAARLASHAAMLVSCATILGCLVMPWLAEKAGRRGALGVYFASHGIASQPPRFGPFFGDEGSAHSPLAADANPGKQPQNGKLPDARDERAEKRENGIPHDRQHERANAPELIANRAPQKGHSPAEQEQRE